MQEDNKTPKNSSKNIKLSSNTTKTDGKIVSVRGHVVEVSFLNEKPEIHEMLTLKDDPQCK